MPALGAGCHTSAADAAPKSVIDSFLSGARAKKQLLLVPEELGGKKRNWRAEEGGEKAAGIRATWIKDI